MQKEKSCCAAPKNKKGILSGILFGILPHFFCIFFALFSIIGAVTITGFLKKFLLIPHFFTFLIIISLILATVSSVIYLRRNSCLCPFGIKNKWKYLTTVYSVTILINLLMFYIVIPTLANANFQKASAVQKELSQNNNLSELSLDVQIPCSGHAPLIIDEIKKNCDVQSVTFSTPNTFDIKYDPQKTTPEKIAALDIFKTYKATLN